MLLLRLFLLSTANVESKVVFGYVPLCIKQFITYPPTGLRLYAQTAAVHLVGALCCKVQKFSLLSNRYGGWAFYGKWASLALPLFRPIFCPWSFRAHGPYLTSLILRLQNPGPLLMLRAYHHHDARPTESKKSAQPSCSMQKWVHSSQNPTGLCSK
jgi:hypothetical protein